MPPSASLALRHVAATRYVLPLREGGSLPGLLEADDLGTYVVKFRGAGQGRKALVAEVIAAELARRLGLRVPELVLVEVDPRLGQTEPDQEVQDLLRASAGGNLGVDFLPGSLGFDPKVDPVAPEEAAAVVWFDALVLNVDRSWRNPNLLRWHGQMWLIDHGAALYFAHSWERRASAGARAYDHVGEHVLLPAAGDLGAADARLAPLLDEQALWAATRPVPDEWLAGEPGFDGPDDVRAAYVEVLAQRLASRSSWVPPLQAAQEVARARL
jgi:hypothetical protein